MSKRRFRSRRRWEDEYTNLFDDYEEVEAIDDDERGWDDVEVEAAAGDPDDTYLN